jgi:RNA polymerase sigma-70 factor (ECF subfamily)
LGLTVNLKGLGLVNNDLITDEELLLQIRRNDSSALELLYDRYSPLLYTFIKKIVGDKEEAETVLSDVFFIIWKWTEHFDFVIYNAYTWMVLLARVKAIDSLKRKRGDTTIPEYNDEHEIRNILPILSPEIETIELQNVLKMRNTVATTINSLSDEQMYLLSLAYYEGLDEKTIAGKVNIPVANVKLKLQLIMEILMDKLGIK